MITNSYTDIPLWENTRRLAVLEEIRKDALTYFNRSRGQGFGEDRIEEIDAVHARQRINCTIKEAHLIITAAGLSHTITWTAPPAVGGRVHHLDLLFDMFTLCRLQIPPQHAVDHIERALGVYDSNRVAAFVRTINPFWWLKRSLLWLLCIPFMFLGALGFDARRAEGSVFGKILKLLFAISALLTILNYLGWLPATRTLLGIE